MKDKRIAILAGQRVTEDIRPNDQDTLITVAPSYPILGGFEVPDGVEEKLNSLLVGLPRYAGCVEKAELAQKIFGGIIVMGAMRVWSAGMKSAYGYDFNPPRELHAWVVIRRKPIIIADLALPGVIERGSIESDEQGPFITGRAPAMLVGAPPKWVTYEQRALYV